jgi:hypothetical protein
VRTGLSVFLIFSGLALGGDTQLLFDPTSPDVGPFPSDVLTDKSTHATELRRDTGAHSVQRCRDAE